MTGTALDQRREVIAGIVDEIGTHYPRGRLLVAVDGAPGSGASGIADALAEAYRAAGRDARVVGLAPAAELSSSEALAAFDEAAFRREVLDPFRADAAPDAVLVVTGQFLLVERLRGIWHFSLYVDSQHAATDAAYLADASPFFTASLVVDTSGPVPKRVFSDSC